MDADMIWTQLIKYYTKNTNSSNRTIAARAVGDHRRSSVYANINYPFPANQYNPKCPKIYRTNYNNIAFHFISVNYSVSRNTHW